MNLQEQTERVTSMRKTFWLLAAGCLLATAADAQTPQSYTGQEKREIKALSSAEIDALLNGHGMGLAKAAELNHFPGPRHVLELASELQLTDKQKAETQKAFETMHSKATRIGKLVVAQERELDTLFAEEKMDSAKLKRLTAQLAALQGELRLAHLEAHLKMKKLLSKEQVAKYDELRGYLHGSSGRSHKHSQLQ